jgi:predicted NAD/FAD-dependent oxidoreductase
VEDGVRDVVVVGAGVAGLQCARRLAAAGVDLVVVDRAVKPGGRCATRSVAGAVADYGPLFIHGGDARFLAAVDSIEGVTRIAGWPHRVEGRGKPCQPEAFATWETRLALVEGVNRFPAALAAGLPIRLGFEVASVTGENGKVSVRSRSGETLEARDLVLATALEQALPFLGALDSGGAAERAVALLSMFATVPCLAVIGVYAPAATAPVWDVCYPEDDEALLAVGNESSKRPGATGVTLVVQGSPRWSHANLEHPPAQWAKDLLDRAARRMGTWVSSPAAAHPHRWRYSRLDRANELAGPLEFEVDGSHVALAGELFAPGGGLQAAWVSGDRVAARIIERRGRS